MRPRRSPRREGCEQTRGDSLRSARRLLVVKRRVQRCERGPITSSNSPNFLPTISLATLSLACDFSPTSARSSSGPSIPVPHCPLWQKSPMSLTTFARVLSTISSSFCGLKDEDNARGFWSEVVAFCRARTRLVMRGVERRWRRAEGSWLAVGKGRRTGVSNDGGGWEGGRKSSDRP